MTEIFKEKLSKKEIGGGNAWRRTWNG